MVVELILAEDLINVAKTGDSVVLKDDGTFEIKKSDDIEKERARKLQMAGYAKRHPESDPIAEGERTARQEDYDEEKLKAKKEYDPRIEKYLSINKEQSWALLEKFYKNGHLDSYDVLKEVINKIAICPDVTDKFEKIMEGWMRDGEADVSSIEKIINSCKKEDGNVVIEGDDKKVSKARYNISNDSLSREKQKKKDEENEKKLNEKQKKLNEEDVTKEVLDEVTKEKHGAAHSQHAHTCPTCREDIGMPKKMKDRLEGKKEIDKCRKNKLH